MKHLLHACLLFCALSASAQPALPLGKTLSGTPIVFPNLSKHCLYINVWADWCPHCVKEFKVLNHFYQAHQKHIDFVAWNADQLPEDQLKRLGKKYRFTFPQTKALDLSAFGGDLSNVPFLPVTIVLSKDTPSLKVLPGEQTEDSLIDACHGLPR